MFRPRFGPAVTEADLPVGFMRWNPVSRGERSGRWPWWLDVGVPWTKVSCWRKEVDLWSLSFIQYFIVFQKLSFRWQVGVFRFGCWRLLKVAFFYPECCLAGCVSQQLQPLHHGFLTFSGPKFADFQNMWSLMTENVTWALFDPSFPWFFPWFPMFS